MRTFLICILVILAAPLASADTVTLNDGSKIVGRVTIQSADEVWILPDSGADSLRVSMSDVASVEIEQVVAEEPMGPPAHFAANAHKECLACGGTGCRVCQHCQGNWKHVALAVECDKCDGTGAIVCPACHGNGEVQCRRCRGRGKIREYVGTKSNGRVYRAVYRWVDCPGCVDGKRRCPGCGGKSLSARVAAGAVGECLVKCQACGGTGQRERYGECPHCDRGYVACSGCLALRQRDREIAQLRVALQESQAPLLTRYFAAFNRAAAERAAYGNVGSFPPLTLIAPHEVPRRIDYWLDVNKVHAESDVYRAIAANRSRLREFFGTAQLGVTNTLRFFSPKLPIDFASRDDTRVFVLKGLLTEFELDLLRLPTPEHRARKVVEMLVSPLLLQIDRALHGSGCAHYGIVVCYGSENFRGDAGDRYRSEAVALLVRADKCHEFARGKITVEKLLQDVECYIADQYTGLAGGMVRVALWNTTIDEMQREVQRRTLERRLRELADED